MSGLGAGLGMLLDVANTELDYQRAKSLKKKDIQYQKEMADYYYDLGIKKFNETGYEAQAQQLKNAGLNIGLMYGSAGQGGQSTTTPSPTQPINYTPKRQGVMDMAALQNAEANTKLAEAQANKAQAEAEAIGGYKKEESQATTKSITQGIENQKAQELLTKAQERLTDIQGTVADMSMEDAVKKINYETERAYHEALSAKYEANLSNETYNDKKEIIKQQAVYELTKVLLTKSQIQKTDEETRKIANDIELNTRGMNVQEFEAYLKSKNIPIQNLPFKVFSELRDVYDKILGTEKYRRESQYNERK